MEDLAAVISDAKANPAFADKAWITFYLSGDTLRHNEMRPHLEALNATNLAGSEGGFVYAKVPVDLNVKDIERKIEAVRKIASKAEIEIDIIDLDSSDDVKQSKFLSLWNAG